MKRKRFRITCLIVFVFVLSYCGYNMVYATDSKTSNVDDDQETSQNSDEQIDYEFFEALGLYHTTAVFPDVITMIDGSWEILDNGQRKFIHNDNRDTVNGWQYIDGHWYFFDMNGIMYTGWLEDNGHIYYLSEDSSTIGQMAIGWKCLSIPPGNTSYWFYFNESGIMATGWKYIAHNGVSSWYYFNTNGTMHTGWLSNGGYWYYMKTNGVMTTGWYQISNNVGAYWYFFGDNGRMVTGWNTISGNIYYFNSNGMMQIGWNTITGNTYYFDATGIMQTGWLSYDGHWYYLNSNGVMTIGWCNISNNVGTYRYYFENNGIMVTGWKTISGNTYYFNSNGMMQTGWILDGGHWYYLQTNGIMSTGWRDISNNVGTYRYYFENNGIMVTGWKTISGNTYYFDSDGKMITGWKTISGDTYYFNSNGVMKTGWNTISGKKYYFGSNGIMAIGWKTIDGKKYYFESTGEMVTGWYIIEGKRYYFNYYGVMVTGWNMIGGSRYYFNYYGVMVTGWNMISGNRYYFDVNGVMVTGWNTIAGYSHFFDSSGRYQSTTRRAIIISNAYLPSEVEIGGWENCLLSQSYYDGDEFDQIETASSLSRDEFYGIIDDVMSNANEGDITYLCITCHGLQNGLLDMCTDHYISGQMLRDKLDEYDGKVVLLLNACYSGTIINRGESIEQGDFLSAFINENRSGELVDDKYLVLCSSSSNELSYGYDYHNNPNIVIGWANYYWMYGGGWNINNYQEVQLAADANNDFIVTLDELYHYSYQAIDTQLDYQTIVVYPSNSNFTIFAKMN